MLITFTIFILKNKLKYDVIKKIAYNKIVEKSLISGKEKFLKTLYKFTTAILILILSIFAVIYLRNVYLRNYCYPLKYKDEVFEYSNKYDIDSTVVFSVIKIESGFNEKSVSKKNAKGLMQIKDETADYIAKKLNVINYDIMDYKTNIEFGTFYIKYLLEKFNDLNTAIIAYNAGEGNVSIWLNNSEYSLDKKTLITTPFKETNAYLNRFNETFIKYRKLYGQNLDKTL